MFPLLMLLQHMRRESSPEHQLHIQHPWQQLGQSGETLRSTAHSTLKLSIVQIYIRPNKHFYKTSTVQLFSDKQMLTFTSVLAHKNTQSWHKQKESPWLQVSMYVTVLLCHLSVIKARQMANFNAVPIP